MTMIRFHQRSHRLVLAKTSWAAAATAARAAIPGLIAVESRMTVAMGRGVLRAFLWTALPLLVLLFVAGVAARAQPGVTGSTLAIAAGLPEAKL